MLKKILVVDDDVEFVDLVRKKLEFQNYEVIGAFDGEDGFAKIKTEKPDLIILDIVLPHLTGYALLTRMKQYPEMRFLPIIVVTRHEGLMKFFENERIQAYFIKPVKLNDLADKVKDCIGEIQGKRILLIDDEPETIAEVENRLKQKEYIVINALNGKEALEKMRMLKPDLIICDVFMPVMNGTEFLKAIKAKPEASSIPIIMLTSKGLMKEYFEAFGVEEVLSKPLSIEEILAKIKFLLTNKTLILCNDDTQERLTSAVEEKNLIIDIVASQKEMIEKTNKYRYDVLVAYLGCISSPPEEFNAAIRALKNKNSALIIYSNDKVKGIEKDNIIVIRELKRKWKNAGIDEFFDIRVSEVDFPELLYSCCLRKYG